MYGFDLLEGLLILSFSKLGFGEFKVDLQIFEFQTPQRFPVFRIIEHL